MEGLRWLCHLSLHCLPSLPGTHLARNDHLCAPYLSTRRLRRLSSSSLQGFFLMRELFLELYSDIGSLNCSSFTNVFGSGALRFMGLCRRGEGI
jgi:hypothetical protein